MRIALAGNPNSGKTTMYNALTGRNERVGNWSFPNKRILETIHETPACVKGITIEYYIF